AEEFDRDRIEDLTECVEPAMTVRNVDLVHRVARGELFRQRLEFVFDAGLLGTRDSQSVRETFELRAVGQRRLQARDQFGFECVEVECARTAIETDALALIAHLAGMTRCAAKPGPGAPLRIGFLREADRKTIWIRGGGR